MAVGDDVAMGYFSRFRPTWDEVSLVVVFLVAAATFYFSGPLAGTVCLVVAVGLITVLWTPVRGWLGIPPHASRDAGTEPLTAADDAQLRKDLGALATELNDFFVKRRAGIDQVSEDQANRYETETRRIYEQRFEARAFQMCERLHTRGWITDPQWENLRGFDLRLTLPGERIVDVARRFGVI
jgi:hypothetical protein